MIFEPNKKYYPYSDGYNAALAYYRGNRYAHICPYSSNYDRRDWIAGWNDYCDGY